MEKNEQGREQGHAPFVTPWDVWKLVAAVVLLGVLMWWAWNFVGPSGQRMGLGSFIVFFLRELLILGLALVGAVAAAFFD